MLTFGGLVEIEAQIFSFSQIFDRIKTVPFCTDPTPSFQIAFTCNIFLLN